MTYSQFLPIDEGLRQLRAFRKNDLPILCAGCAMMGNAAGVRVGPIALVLVSPQPNIVDLVRVHKHDGDGQASFEWQFALHPDPRQSSWAVLKVSFTTPVACEFSLAFDFVRHRDCLKALADTTVLMLITNEKHGPDNTLALTDIPIDDLRELLVAHRLRRRLARLGGVVSPHMEME